MKSQIALEYLFLAILVLAAIAVLVNYSSAIITDSTNQHYLVYAVNLIKDAVSEVGFMGYPARKTLDIYIPSSVNSSRSFILNNTLNYGLLTSPGMSDIFFVSDYCITGNLPTDKGYYPLKIVPSNDCVIIDYNDFSAYPSPINIFLPLNANTTININIYNLLFDDIEANLTSTVNLANFVDLDNNTAGKQLTKNLGFINSSGSVIVSVTFFGNYTGTYTGYFEINSTKIPVTIRVFGVVYPMINYTNPSSIEVYLYENVCFNATITPGSEPIDKVWVTLKIPGLCWAVNGSCDAGCSYSNLGLTNYYNNPGCSGSCPASGSFYAPAGACNIDGTGNCYKFSGAVSYNTTCAKSAACNSSCTGTGVTCPALPLGNCTVCGCNITSGQNNNIKWNETFASSADWATWAADGSGLSYITSSTNCINDDNDDCIHARGGTTSYTLTKQSSVNLTECNLGSAWFNISWVRETGTQSTTDCIYVALSNNSGTSWSANNLVFCDDNPAATYKLLLPNSYLTSGFRVRVTKNGFTGGSRNAYLDGFTVSCKKNETACGGVCNNCSVYTNSSACGGCGCSWNATSWNWAALGLTSGYSSYQQCTWSNLASSNVILFLSDSGATCAGANGDGVYGLDYNLTKLGNYTLLSGYVNDSLGNTASDFVNTTITVRASCKYNWTVNSQALFNEGTFVNTVYNTTVNAVTLSGSNKIGTYTSKVFNSNSSSTWLSFSWTPGAVYGAGYANITDEDILLLLHLEETNGTTFIDSSGKGHNATLVGTATLNVSGKEGKAIYLNNINRTTANYLTVPHSSGFNLNTTGGTICAWLNIADKTQYRGGIVHKGENETYVDEEYSLQFYGAVGTALPAFVVRDTALVEHTATSSVELVPGTWQQVCGMYNQTVVKIYVDGVERGSTAITPGWTPISKNGSLQIGAQTRYITQKSGIKGYIDEVIMWRRDLRASEIQELYKAGIIKLNATVMSCNDALCSGETWSNEYTNSTGVLLNVPTNQYFRFRFNFFTDNSAFTPLLYNVTVNYQKLCG